MDSPPRFTFASVRPGRSDTVIKDQTFLAERKYVTQGTRKPMPIRTESERRQIKQQVKYESTLKRIRNSLVNNLDPLHVMSVEEQDEYLNLAGYTEGSFTNDSDKLICAQSVKSRFEDHIKSGNFKKTFPEAYIKEHKLLIVKTPILAGKIISDHIEQLH